MLFTRRTYMLFFLVVSLALFTAACGSQAEEEPVQEAETADEVVAEEDDHDDDHEHEDEVDDHQDDDESTASEAESDEQDEPEQEAAITNSVTVEDQAISPDNSLTISSVTAGSDSWIVIHAQADGRPGPILGRSLVSAGENLDVTVEIDPAAATETVYAMLHVDAGSAGEFDFPGGDDVPATDAEGNVVTPAFMITGGLVETMNVLLAQSEELGPYLTDGEGMALYTFARDEPGTSNCYDGCAAAWPPLFVDEGARLVAGEGVTGELGTTLRDDGKLMATYNGWPLYYWVNDNEPGDTTGHLVNNVWAVAYPETHVFLGGNDELGSFLIGPDGLTLYRFNNDEPGLSNCYDQCATNWPPLLVDEGVVPRGNAGVVGSLGTTERDDGTFQVTYQDMPLYYWFNDAEPGDATGQDVGGVWFVVPPYSVRVSGNEELGSFLVGADGMTLYLFTQDEEGISNCYDQCATNWPPLLVQPGEVPVPAAGVIGKLDVTERDDETFQVMYNGQPLYFWVNDQEPGDTTGQGVGDVWFVVPPE